MLIIKKWKIKGNFQNNDDKNDLAKEFGISPIALRILQNRKIDSRELISEYLDVENAYISPFDFSDMKEAVERINKAIRKGEKICIYGDYDADGITATALIYIYLKSIHANIDYYIPERGRDGYGLNKNAIDTIKSKNVDVILTVDNGSVAFEEVLYAKSIGIDTVITDHHKVMGKLPEACAVVNPYKADCSHLKYGNFAGVGVAFKLVQAMENGKQSYEELIEKYSHLVALGTIGDAIELKGETKYVVQKGIENIRNTNSIPIKALLKSIGAKSQEIDSSFVAFSLVPRINACGRMENAKVALRLLISEDISQAEIICGELNKLNLMRKDTENSIFDLVEELLNKEPWRKNEKVIIAEGENWNHGVLGIVAARIMQKYGKPCVIITIEGEKSRGSCRSFEGFSIYETLSKCASVLLKFGGHTLAAGFNMRTENIEKFKKMMHDICENHVVPTMTINIDLTFEPKELKISLIDEIKILEPFGNGNFEPIFGFLGLKLKKIFTLSQGKHLKLLFEKDGYDFEVLFFNKTLEEFPYKESDKIDVVARLSKNTYRGVSRISCYLVDLKLSDCNLDYILEQKSIYSEFKEKDIISKGALKLLHPSRNDFALVYRYIKTINNKFLRVDIINYRIFKNDDCLLKLNVILDIFKELGILDLYSRGDEIKVNIRTLSQKVNIEKSKLFSNICRKEREDLLGKRI